MGNFDAVSESGDDLALTNKSAVSASVALVPGGPLPPPPTPSATPPTHLHRLPPPRTPQRAVIPLGGPMHGPTALQPLAVPMHGPAVPTLQPLAAPGPALPPHAANGGLTNSMVPRPFPARLGGPLPTPPKLSFSNHANGQHGQLNGQPHRPNGRADDKVWGLMG
mmetsp:Transcript_34262/g.73975  ORF Transcript_34262/g.73975 Transcript_34262/m.73975 type:complete len:165 (-) Transcript_34262:69-563(-)